MKKHQREQEEVNRKWLEITPSEYDQLRAGMAKYKQIRINGRLQSRWMQYMLELGVVRLDEWGDAVVKDPVAYTKWNQALDNMDKRDEREQKEFFKNHPEAQAEWRENVRGWTADFKRIAQGMRVQQTGG